MGGARFYQGQTAAERIGPIDRSRAPRRSSISTGTLSDDELAGLYTACDCLVHPYRGEGFGLPIAEAMACGLPVIVTGYGAALDYCNEENAYLIPARIMHFREKRIGGLETVDYPWLAEPDRGGPASPCARSSIIRTRPGPGAGRPRFIRSHLTWDQRVEAAEARAETSAVRAADPRGSRGRGPRASTTTGRGSRCA